MSSLPCMCEPSYLPRFGQCNFRLRASSLSCRPLWSLWSSPGHSFLCSLQQGNHGNTEVERPWWKDIRRSSVKVNYTVFREGNIKWLSLLLPPVIGLYPPTDVGLLCILVLHFLTWCGIWHFLPSLPRETELLPHPICKCGGVGTRGTLERQCRPLWSQASLTPWLTLGCVLNQPSTRRSSRSELGVRPANTGAEWLLGLFSPRYDGSNTSCPVLGMVWGSGSTERRASSRVSTTQGRALEPPCQAHYP